MPQAWHRLVFRPWNLICRGLGHSWRIAPVILACEHVDRALFCINARHARTTIPPAEVEIQISVENTVCLRAVHMPHKLFVLKGRRRAHHLDDVNLDFATLHMG